MPIYLYKLIPPRPTFPVQITPEEGAALLSGPVADPQGTYGITIVDAPNEVEAKRICANDPAIAAKVGFAYDVFEMPDAVAAPR